MELNTLYLLLLALAAGFAMPLGAVVAKFENFCSDWFENEFRHSVFAFGGGALLSAVALVLIPQGIEHLNIFEVIISMLSGTAFFMWLDKKLHQKNTPASNLVAMLSDFIPEAMAMGAMFSANKSQGVLLALLIGMQNIPEGFNAYREMIGSKTLTSKKIFSLFILLSFLGPVCAFIGLFYLSHMLKTLSFIMVFASSGILYLIFQDIATQAKMEKAWAPATGAVAGFLIGLIGHMILG